MSADTEVRSQRVRAALLAAGHAGHHHDFPAGTRTAADAAAAVGCDGRADRQVHRVPRGRRGRRVIITSGANRVDPAKAGAALGREAGRADADWVRAVTGFAIGGVAPGCHITPPLMLLDEDLLALDPIWAAAGTPSHVFRTPAAELKRISGGKVASVKAKFRFGIIGMIAPWEARRVGSIPSWAMSWRFFGEDPC